MYFEYFFLTFWDFVADVGIAYILERLYRIHQIRLLCDHQELACTPEDPPWRVSMKEMSFRNICGNIYWVIDKTVWKPTLVTPICFGPGRTYKVAARFYTWTLKFVLFGSVVVCSGIKRYQKVLSNI